MYHKPVNLHPMPTNDMTKPHDIKLKIQPYPYQMEGIHYGMEKKRLIIGDEPGLGKTLQSIGIIHTAGAYPCLVVCPSSLKINWQREFEKFTPHRALILSPNVCTAWPYLLSTGMYHMAIVNYESLRKYFVLDMPRGARLCDVVFTPHINRFRSIIIDESHRVKDPGAQQTIFTRGIASGKEYIMLLSGTPVVNRPEDLISQLSIMGRLKEFGGMQQFIADYCWDTKKKDGPRVPLSVLSRKLYNTCMIRREKKHVLKDLPDKTRVNLFLEISNRKEYQTAETDLRRYLEEYTRCTDYEIRRKMRMESLNRFMTLRALTNEGKCAKAKDFIDTFLGNDQKLILFCTNYKIIDDFLKNKYPQAVYVTGRENTIQKQYAVDAFQHDPGVKLIICAHKAAGVGYTLTAASNVAFLELPWTYADCQQCEDRAHRISQKHKVTCYYLLGHNTIDGVIQALIHRKRSVASRIVDSQESIPEEDSLLDDYTMPGTNARSEEYKMPGREDYFNEVVTAFLNNETL
ncbi:MAG: DEAD/DEAH box helicase [Prevotellaceae bacterium]|nr:DEAD/DEAH box helicase [Prevotellaceae bacterium]